MKLSSPIAGFAMLGMLVAAGAQAAPVTYFFKASGFTSFSNNNTPAPYSTVTGDVTIDGTTVLDIDLTIGSHTYSTADVQYIAWTPGAGVLGGFGPDSGFADSNYPNTNDFQLAGDFASLSWWTFFYSVPGINDAFTPYSLSVTTSELPKPVPLPGAFGMLMAGLGVLGAVTRRGKQAT